MSESEDDAAESEDSAKREAADDAREESESTEPKPSESEDPPKRKRTKSAELAAQVPKISNPSEPSGSSLFDAGWDSLLGGDKKSSPGDDLFKAPLPSSGSGSAKAPSFAPPIAGAKPAAPSVPAPSVAASDEPAAEAPKSDEPAAEDSSAPDEAAEHSKPTTEPKNSTDISAVAGEFASLNPELRAAQEAIAEAAVKARDAAEAAKEAAQADRLNNNETQDDFDMEVAERLRAAVRARDAAKARKEAEAREAAEDSKDDDAEVQDDEAETGSEGADEAEDETEAEEEPPAVRKPEAKTTDLDEERGGSMGLLLVLGAAAAVVLILVFLNSSGNANDGKTAKPTAGAADTEGGGANKAKPSGPRPHPPNETRTRSADRAEPALAPESAEDDTGGETGETGTGETGVEEPAGETGAEEVEAEGTETGEVAEPEVEPEPEPAVADASGKREVDDPRDPSLIPPGTPDKNAKAFLKLPVSLSDGAPLGAIGSTGIHIDDVSMGAGKDNTRCEHPTRSYSVETEYINVCFRAVHSRQDENLRVIWEKDGSVARRGKLKIPEKSHAYKTRAYLRVRPEYVGSWRVRIVPEGEENTGLVVAEFEISG